MRSEFWPFDLLAGCVELGADRFKDVVFNIFVHIEMEHYCPELIWLYFELTMDVVEHQGVKVDEEIAFSMISIDKLPYVRVKQL